MSQDELDALRYWSGLMSKAHGYGGVFNSNNDKDKIIVELDTAAEWCEAVSDNFGVTFENLRTNTDDPPDCFADIDGKTYGIELVELTNQDHRTRANQGESPYSGQLSKDMKWSRDRFETEIKEQVLGKAEKYAKSQVVIDALIVHTAEPWFASNQVEQWIESIDLGKTGNNKRIFLLMFYEPGREFDSWPVFQLCGPPF